MRDHYFLVVFWQTTTLKTRNLQITTGDHYFLAFLEWEITIFLFFLEATTLKTRKSANHNGRSLFSCFFGVGNPYFLVVFLQITTGDHYFLAFLEWEITCSLLFRQAMTLETRKSANHNGRSLFSCFFGVGNPYFLVFFGGDDPRTRKSQITTGDHYFLAFLE